MRAQHGNARLQYADLMHTESADLRNLQVWHAGHVNGVHGLHRERPRGEMSHQLPLARHACQIGTVEMALRRSPGGHATPVLGVRRWGGIPPSKRLKGDRPVAAPACTQ